MNAANHQQTWGVLAAAVEALEGAMMWGGGMGPGCGYFLVFDGGREVGVGVLG